MHNLNDGQRHILVSVECFPENVSAYWERTEGRAEAYFSIDTSSVTPTPAPTPTSTPEPTSTPNNEPQQLGQEVILGVAVTVAVVCVGLGLLIYLIKRK